MEVCRLCLDLVATQGDAKPLDGETRDMVQVVAPELNLEASKNPSVCSECQKTLSRLFDFKSRVFEHEGEIREKVGDRRGTVSLKAAVTGEADPPLDPDRDKAKDRLCRTCLAPIECESFTVLRPSEPDAYLSSMLDMCLVEVDLALTKDPVMCEGCLDNLQKLHHFKSSCQDVEDKIVDYCNKNKLKESTVVDLHAVLESERPRDIEMLTVKDEDGASGSKIKDEEKEVEPKSEDEDEEMSEDEEEDEEMSEDEEVKQEELDIKSETEPGTSDSDNDEHFPNQEELLFFHKENPYNLRSSKSEKILKHPAKIKSEPSSKLHREDEHGVDEHGVKCFKCSNCEFKTSIKRCLKVHIQVVHEGKRLYRCDFCSAKFKSLYSLKLHRNHEHGVKVKYFKCSKCNYKSINKANLKNHRQHVHNRVLHNKCDLCSAKFKSKVSFQVHRKDEHGFKCSKCEYKTTRKNCLKIHEQIVHEGMLRHQCDLCSAKFKSSYSLKLHRKAEHGMNVKYFKCSRCNYKTIDKLNFKKHGYCIHNDALLHKCDLCPAKFVAVRSLQLHKKDEHGVDVK